jgi:hypothetical protein
MDFTTPGAEGLSGDIRIEGLNWNMKGPFGVPGVGRSMARFADLPDHSERPVAGAPVLTMPSPPPSKPRNVWAKRIWLVVFVLFCLEVGIVLTWCPWTKVWSENSILVSYPRLREFLMSGFARGLISGLGLVNIWMGIGEAVRYREGND